MKIENIKPADIERRSFEIITQMLGDKKIDPQNENIIKRAIHTSADFDYADNLYFSDDVAEILKDAIKNGADIVTDTQMAKSGINKKLLGKFGGEVHCFMSDEDVALEAKSRGVTRAVVCMEKACTLQKPVLFAIGNAPTALLRLKELIEENRISPVGIVGVPVGFVNVIESKEQIMTAGVPCIIARGRKGGSNIAAAICNAILYMIQI
jgi:precorrin-8X/cobalt-precorrin-8 methylmutase